MHNIYLYIYIYIIYLYIYTIYISHCVFENLQIFSANAKGFGEEEKVLCGRDIERLQEEMG